MPSKQTFCWCFGGRPPDIQYGINQGTPLKPMAIDIPMPTDENELNAKFEELVNELGLDKPHRDAMFSLPPEKKWQIYCSKKQDKDEAWPDFYIERINTMINIFSYNPEELEQRETTIENLQIALRTQPMSFVVRFIEQEGLQCVLNFLTGMDYHISESSIHTAAIGCLKALMNNPQGRAHVLAHPNSINIIAQSLSVENIKTKIAVLEILGAMCLVPGGHRRVLEAMLHYQKFAAERTRFQGLIFDLDRSTGIYREEVNLKTAIMSFINAVLRCGPGKDYLEFRLHLRYEFLMLGIQPVIEKLRKHENATLDRHLDFFEMMRNDDEKILAKRFEGAHIDTKSASGMFELLRKKLSMSSVYTHLLSLLQHLLLLPYGNSAVATGMWLLVDKIIQQVVLQKNGQDYDAATLEINVKKTIQMLTSETDIKSYQQKLREVEKANDELQSKLAKKEREAEARSQEKDELLDTVGKMKAKLEKETSSHADTKQQMAELNSKLQEIVAQLEAERGERMKLQHLVKTGSLPDDAKVGLSSVSSVIGSGLSDLKTSSLPVAPPRGPPAPPPPPGAPPPPPAPGDFPDGIPGAPPPPMGGFGIPGMAQRRNAPKPKQPLKSFNWSKLDDNKIKGSIWNDLDDTKLYPLLDLEDFEKNFSAYQRKNQDETDDKGSGKQHKTKELSVIDGRRAQNCTILLSKLKLSNEELKAAILSMDSQEDIPKDMLEQLLKYVPTPEETQLLSELHAEIAHMAKADRFLYEMSKISHYEQRVRALYFKKKYQDRMSEVKPRIEAVNTGSQQLIRSKKLKKLLEIVLALGNYMNRGQRGNAKGFLISSLNNMVDTKSSLNRQVTLLHYLVEVLEHRFPDVLKIEQELSLIKPASKVNFTELDKELSTLRVGLKEIEKELEYFQNQTPVSGDRFVSVMNQFATVASYNFSEVEESTIEMKQKFESCQKCFGLTDGKTVQPDEFFGVFDSFIMSMADAKEENERIKKQREEEERRAQLEEKLKKEREQRLMLKRGGSSVVDSNGKITNGNTNPKGEFDDLVSALRTGDIFGDDIAKMKRNRRRVGANISTSRERVSDEVRL